MDEWRSIAGGCEVTTGEWYTVSSPYNGEEIGRVLRVGEKEAEEALSAGMRGAAQTSLLPAHARSRILYCLELLMEEHKEEFIRLLIAEGGKPRKNAVIETARAIETIRISAEEAVRIGGEVIPLDRTMAGEGRIGITQRFPLGIVVGITPFNFPLNLACHKLGPAVASGNAIILKPSSATPFSSLLLGKLLLQAGYPPQAVSVLACRTEIAEKIVSDYRVGCISFTGSPDVGWHLRSKAVCGRVTLELGGNAAVIVHEDADMETAASRIVEGGFSQAGQVCISVQRVFIHCSIYESLLTRIGEMTDRLVLGDPADPGTDIGPMISVQAAEFALARVQAACKSGAELFRGGVIRGSLMAPTILIGTHSKMEVTSKEIFAPVICINPYEQFEDAIDMANDSQYGLQAGVFTRDIGRAQYAFSNLMVGAVMIGDIPTFRVDQMPYGGEKRSGYGREGPRYAIEEMTEMRMMVIRS